MPRNNDNQCVQCGGIRVAGSTLCDDCLKKRLDAEKAENLIKREVIEGLKRKNQKLTGLCERLLDHITNDAVYTGELEQAIYTTWRKNRKEG